MKEIIKSLLGYVFAFSVTGLLIWYSEIIAGIFVAVVYILAALMTAGLAKFYSSEENERVRLYIATFKRSRKNSGFEFFKYLCENDKARMAYHTSIIILTFISFAVIAIVSGENHALYSAFWLMLVSVIVAENQYRGVKEYFLDNQTTAK